MSEQNKLAEVNATLDRFAKLIEGNAEQLLEDKAEFDRQLDKDREEAKRQRAEDKAEWERQLAADKAKWERQLADDRAKWEQQRADDKAKWEQQLAADKVKWEQQLAEDKAKWEQQLAEDKAKWEQQLADDRAKWEQQLAADKAEDEKRQTEWEQQLAADKAKWEQQLAEDKAEDEKRQAEWEQQLAEDKAKWEQQLADDKAEDEKRQTEWERQRAEDRSKDEKRQAEWDNRFANICDQVGGQGSAIGDITEAMTVSDNIIDLVNKFEGIKVTNFAFNARKKYRSKDSKGNTILKPFEIDGLVDGKRVAVVIEAKTSLTTDYVKNFLAKLANFKNAYPEHKHKDVYGAVTFVRADEQALVLSEQHGLFIIRTSPPDVELANNEGFKPVKVI